MSSIETYGKVALKCTGSFLCNLGSNTWHSMNEPGTPLEKSESKMNYGHSKPQTLVDHTHDPWSRGDGPITDLVGEGSIDSRFLIVYRTGQDGSKDESKLWDLRPKRLSKGDTAAREAETAKRFGESLRMTTDKIWARSLHPLSVFDFDAFAENIEEGCSELSNDESFGGRLKWNVYRPQETEGAKERAKEIQVEVELSRS